MNDTHCIFCKILRGEIPAEKIYEDSTTMAFLDIKPINPGHILVIPKEHYVNAYDIPSNIFAHMAETAQKMALAQKKSLEVENVNIYMNNGEHAGQVVFHAHIHVIPRHENDGYGLWHGKEITPAEMQAVSEKLR